MELAEVGIKTELEHVRGHQDAVEGHALTLMERLNVRVDSIAQEFNATCRINGMQPTDADVGGEVGPIWINLPDLGRKKLYSDLVSSAHDEFHGALLRQHWISHGQLASVDILERVAFPELRQAIKARSVGQHNFDVKRVSGILGVGKWLHRWRQRDNPACPLCSAVVEDISHVYRCPNAHMQTKWYEASSQLMQWIEDTTQSTRISSFARLLMAAYRENGPPTIPQGVLGTQRLIWTDQSAIGRDSLLNGFLSTRWIEFIGMEIKGQMTAQTWLSKWIIKLMEFAGTIWGCRNELLYRQGGEQDRVLWEAVRTEIAQGAGHNQRVAALLCDTARPRDDSTSSYLRSWLAAVQAARLSSTDWEVGGRNIIKRWLRSFRPRE